MIEARIFTSTLDTFKEVLAREGAVLKGRYGIHDTIYRNVDPRVPLSDEFLRLRVIPENIWDEKPVILALKKTQKHAVGKESDIPIKIQFDRKEDAKAYYEKHLKDRYVKDFSFQRIGWQYSLANGDEVDLEIVEDKYPTIEIKSHTDAGIEKLCELFNISRDKVISGPSVVAVRNLLIV